MPKVISIGNQGFEDIRKENRFYVDKTEFIREWWESGDSITLIMRPRRFGKTLNMDMLKCFFSNQYADREDLFEGLTIWKDEKYRSIQGTYPVIYLSFADVKQTNYADAVKKIKRILSDLYQQYVFLLQENCMTEMQKRQFSEVSPQMDDVTAQCALQDLAHYLYRFYGKKVILLLDEYDTPMQEACVYGYWKEFTSFIRRMFNSAFTTHPYLERAVMTGITRVSKESVFSDLNNLNVVTTTSEEYETCFGFTEQEVFASLDTFGVNEYKNQVKEWYDGFVFGKRRDIYNPWSITNFLDKKKFDAYWAATSSNSLVSRLIQTASSEIKEQMELLLQNKEIVVHFDEQIIFEQLDQNENAIWSLLLASGYLKAVEVEYRGLLREKWYHLQITNLETMGMFMMMFRGWFDVSNSVYNRFINALLGGNVREMNAYMNEVALATFSNFDSGTHPSSKSQPERFYHGFVLGLLVELRDRYQVKSNRESGYGRYDVMLIPRNVAENAMILEFKVFDVEEEYSLQDTVKSALRQIEEKQYDTELLEAGISKNRIHHYGFAFEGKKVLIDGQ